MMNKTVAALLIASVFASGCAHTSPNPVMLAQLGDDTKSCDGIANEMQEMLQAQSIAESDHNKQVAGNVALGVAGVFLIVPWFFMDTGNAATVDERAAQARYHRLNQMQIDKKCPASPTLAPTAAAVPVTVTAPAAPVAPLTVAKLPTPVAAAAPDTVAATTAPALSTVPTSIPAAQAASPTEVAPMAAAARPAPLDVGSKIGKDSFSVEHMADVRACAAQPQAVLNAKGAGYETYTVACADGNSLAIRCEFGNCRVLR